MQPRSELEGEVAGPAQQDRRGAGAVNSDDDEAIDDYGKALAIDRNHTSILLARAEANRRAGKKKDAKADYEAALKLMEDDDPGRRDAAARLASLLRDSGD